MKTVNAMTLKSARIAGKRRTGAAAAELAVTLPFIVFLFVAAVDYSRIYYYTQTLDNCAQVGALYASGTMPIASSTLTPNDAATTAACAEGVSLNPPLQPQQVTITPNGNTVTVTVAYDYQMLTPFLAQSGILPIAQTVTMNTAPTPWK